MDCGVCVLRAWGWGDRASLVRHANDRAVWRNLRDVFPHPYTEGAAHAWLAFAAADPPPPWTYAIDIEGEAVGGISLVRQGDIERHSAELGYWLGRAFWGRGIMSAAVRALTERALLAPQLYRIYADVFSWNPASMRVLMKAGFRREAVRTRSAIKDGVIIDRVLFAITRDPGLPYEPYLPELAP